MKVLCEEIRCQSCGWDFVTRDADSDRCSGCGRTLCPTCAHVHSHWLDGEHGIGDPTTRIDEMREELAAGSDRYKRERDQARQARDMNANDRDRYKRERDEARMESERVSGRWR
jgi:hypothetical protein